MDCSINGNGTSGQTMGGGGIQIYHHYLYQDRVQCIKRQIVKVVKENIATLKNNIGVEKAKARHITQKSQKIHNYYYIKISKS